MAEWYYSLNSQQKGPVSWETLQQLASSGKLRRADMVWREGMANWQAASRVDGLFPRSDVDIRVTDDRPTRRAVAAEDEDDDAVDEDRPRRKKKRKKQSSPGAMVAIIGSSVGGGLLLLIIIIVVLVRSGRNPGGAGGGAGGAPVPGQPLTYTVSLRQDQTNTRNLTFQQGQQVEIVVRTPAGLFRVPDVDLFVTRTNDGGFFLSDEDISKDCHLSFVAPATDQYSVKVDNLGPGAATSTVTITVR